MRHMCYWKKQKRFPINLAFPFVQALVLSQIPTHQEGHLIKIKKGVYKYHPENIRLRVLKEFTPEQKEVIFNRDNYRCVICGLGRADGAEIHADHIKPKDLGGEAEIENGQTLCAPHNFKKKNYRQTETGKRMFIRLYELARKSNDSQTQRFCADILEVYEKNNINGHIINLLS